MPGDGPLVAVRPTDPARSASGAPVRFVSLLPQLSEAHTPCREHRNRGNSHHCRGEPSEELGRFAIHVVAHEDLLEIHITSTRNGAAATPSIMATRTSR